MPKNTDQRKFKNRASDKATRSPASDARRFSQPSDGTCRRCRDGQRGSCCFRVNNLGSNPARCPRGKTCWECVNETTECECAQFGGDYHCESPNGRWRWNGPTVECKDCPCHNNPSPADLQVVTPGCSHNPHNPLGADFPCCMNVFSKNLDVRDLNKKETEIYIPYNLKTRKVENCRCGCMKGSGELYCSESNENQLNAIKSHAGGVSPLQIKFFRSESYDVTPHTIYDKYRQRFRRLYYNERVGNTQNVKWEFAVKRFSGEFESGRGINKGKRYDAKDCIVRFSYVPNAEIPMNPRETNGDLMYTPNQWMGMSVGAPTDIPQDHHVIEIPFDKEVSQAIGNVTIPVVGNYAGVRKVLKFDIEFIDSETGLPLSSFDIKNYSRENDRLSSKYQSFSGYQDCFYEGNSCYSYETAWDSIYIVLEG